jgi:photosystem II stability/assembly factor-like uncharacterized protein
MDIFFVNDKIGWVVGNNSTLFKTTDFGESWTQINVPISQNLTTVFFINENVGWIGGSKGGIIKTVDGGKTWINQTSNIDFQIEALAFISPQIGYAAANNWTKSYMGAIIQTNDGGNNWLVKLQYNGVGFIDVHFPNKYYGFVVGSNGYLSRTSNQGRLWDISFITNTWLHSVFFINESLGWISGGSPGSDFIMKTTNAGNTWATLHKTSNNGFLSGIYFIDEKNGWACGNRGTILRSTDGGTSWVKEETNVNVHLQEFSFTENSGYCVGERGTLLKRNLKTNNKIEILTPQIGEEILAGSTYNILWVSSDVSFVTIGISADNGKKWKTIVDSIPSTGIYSWVVPQLQSSKCRIRISDYSQKDIFSISKGSFIIRSARKVELIQPKELEVLSPNSIFEIKWISSDVEKVKIEYSLDNGASWYTIIDSTPSVGIYKWRVPEISSIQGKIRISDILNTEVVDVSKNVFIVE